jgi:hypothetical protein
VKGEVKIGLGGKTVGTIGIPASAFAEVVAIAGFLNGALAAVFKFQGDGRAGSQRLVENDGQVVTVGLNAVFPFAGLIVGERALFIFDGFDAEIGVQIEEQ